MAVLHRHLLFVTAFTAIAGATAVQAQDYPVKPVRLVTSAPGGGGDVVARLIAASISGPLGQQVIVDNRGAGVLGPEIVAKAAPDGYTLLSKPNDFWLLPFMQNVSYDPVGDFSAVALTVISPNIVVVHPSLPVKSISELIALAKARPGVLNFAAGSTGSSSHLAGELFKVMAGINIVHIPYKGAGPSLNDTLGGQVHLLFTNTAAATPHVKSGRLRALAVTTAQPTALAPGLTTVAAAGLPGYEAAAIYGVFAPAGTPAALVNRLNQEIVRAITRPDVKEKFFATGVEVVGGSAEQMATKMKAEMARLGKIIKDAGIHE